MLTHLRLHAVPDYLPVSVCVLTHLRMFEHQRQHVALTRTHIHPAAMI